MICQVDRGWDLWQWDFSTALEVTSILILLFPPQTKKAFQKESLSLVNIDLMFQPDSNHRDWNPTQRHKDRMIFRKK